MKLLKSALLLSMLVVSPCRLTATPVAKVIHAGKQAHLSRDFERRILSSGEGIEARDIVEVEDGILVFEMEGAQWSVSAGSRFRLKKDAMISVVELFSGQYYFKQNNDVAWRIETNQAEVKGGKGEAWLALDVKGLEAAIISGEIQWNSVLISPKWQKCVQSRLYRFALGRVIPIAEKTLDPLEVVVFSERLKSSEARTERGSMDIDGKISLPVEEIDQNEKDRRLALSKAKKNKQEYLDLLKTQFQTLRADQYNDFQEVMKREEAFTFPVPFGVPPK